MARLVPRNLLRLCGAANGQSIFFRRVAYDRIGGHSGVRDHLVEDVALGRAVAAEIGDGMRLYNCTALNFTSCRMYRAFWEVWEGFTKNIRAAFEGSLAGFLFIATVQICCFLLPCLMLPFAGAYRSALAEEVALIYLIRLIITVRFRTSWVSLIFHPFGHAIAMAIGLNSWRKMNAGGVTWKGRKYQHSTGIS
jgi:chlorobactene glucosyltransferase